MESGVESRFVKMTVARIAHHNPGEREQHSQIGREGTADRVDAGYVAMQVFRAMLSAATSAAGVSGASDARHR